MLREGVDHPSMVIDMNESKIRTVEQVRQFLQGTLDVEFLPHGDDEARYAHVAEVVRRLGYARLHRGDRGQVLRYLGVTTGYASAQVKRLVARALSGQPLVKRYAAPAQAFAQRYTSADIELLALVDREFGTLSGPATAHVSGRPSSSARRSCGVRSASRSAAPRSRSTSRVPRRPTAGPSSLPSSCTTITPWPPPSARSA